MKKDVVDDILEQWSEEKPELDTASLGVVIRVISLNRAFLRQATEALAPLDLELFEYDVLSALRRQGRPFALPATGIARETGLSSGAMTNRIDKLEERGLVSRNPDESDRRAVIVALTPEGKRAIDDADPTARGKVHRLGEWQEKDIFDPYRRPRAAYEVVLEDIEAGVASWVKRLEE